MIKFDLDNCKKEEQIEDNLYFVKSNLSVSISEGLCGKMISLYEDNVKLYMIPFDQIEKVVKETNKCYGESK